MRKCLCVLACIIVLCSGYRTIDRFHIDAVTNANRHNTLGTEYMRERCYYAAIQEFKIAISLNSDTQSSAVYYNNLGEVYMIIGYPGMAEDCFERALKLYGLNFKFYQNMAECYAKLGLTNKKILQLKRSKNPLDKVTLGLLYIQRGDKQKGIIVLDDFCMSEPDLIITTGVRGYLKKIVAE